MDKATVFGTVDGSSILSRGTSAAIGDRGVSTGCKMRWFVYIVKCLDHSLYTGITTNLDRRIWQHNNKLGAKSIRGKLPVKLIYQELWNSRQEAAKREREIKGWKREEKLSFLKLNS